jgi:hypothetical protein
MPENWEDGMEQQAHNVYAETPDPHSLNSANLGFCYEGIQWLPKLDLRRLQSTQCFENSCACLLIHLSFSEFFLCSDCAMDSA